IGVPRSWRRVLYVWRSVCQSIRRSPARRHAEARRFFRKLSADSGSLPPLENTSALAEVSIHRERWASRAWTTTGASGVPLRLALLFGVPKTPVDSFYSSTTFICCLFIRPP